MKYAFILAALLSSSAFAGHPVQSLNDLPKHWEGVAGGLLEKKKAVFEILKVKGVSRDDGKGAINATYTVDALLAFGSRTLMVKEIALSGSETFPNRIEVTMKVDDELVTYVNAVVLYDEVSNTFSLREMPCVGSELRFAFLAPASL